MVLYTYNKKQLNSIFRLIVEIDMITDSILTGTAPGGKYYEYVKRLLEDLSGEEAANKWSGSSYLWTRDVQSCTGQGYGRFAHICPVSVSCLVDNDSIHWLICLLVWRAHDRRTNM